MAVYKVPQDVEAEDKLIGPFTFRQFIYLIIVAIAIALGWFMSRIFIGLAILPLPIILFFGALALPLRKDQSMEVYLAAMIKFFLKPKKRMWDPEGQFSRITISAPTTEERLRTKEFGRQEAGERLEYLAQVIDTQGWASRGVTTTAEHSLNPDITAEAQSAEDVFADNQSVNQNFFNLIEKQEEDRRQQTISQFQQGFQSPPANDQPLQPKTAQDYVTFPGQPKPDSFAAINSRDDATPVFNPYPQMRQRVINPGAQDNQPAPQPQAITPQPTPTDLTGQVQPTTPPATPVAPRSESVVQLPASVSDDQSSPTPPSPDIIRLASNNDLSIDAIAREAHRINEKHADGQEVVISLR